MRQLPSFGVTFFDANQFTDPTKSYGDQTCVGVADDGLLIAVHRVAPQVLTLYHWVNLHLWKISPSDHKCVLFCSCLPLLLLAFSTQRHCARTMFIEVERRDEFSLRGDSMKGIKLEFTSDVAMKACASLLDGYWKQVFAAECHF